ncbi:MAG: Ig-like domain-containing protein [Terracidiphilus sp.]
MRAPAKESHVVERKYLALMAGCLLAIPLAGCTSSQVDTVAVSPATQSVAVGQAAQFSAAASTSHGTHPSSTTNVTDSVIWTSSAPAVATISASGLATGVSAGATTITATMPGYTGEISSTAVLTVTGTGGAGNPGNADITTITVIPGSQSVASPNQTSQYIAIGSTSAGATADLSTKVAWTSSSPTIATINSKGLATGVSQGTATITALYTNTDQSIASGTATFQVVGGTTEAVTALTIYPSEQSLTQAQTTQFFVVGTQGSSGLQVDETAGVAWTSSDENVATIGTKGNGTPGLATAKGAGSSTVTATYTNADNSVAVATATVSVTIGAAQELLISINVVPASITVSNKGMTAQYLAFGTYSATPTVRDITNSVTWISTLPGIASISTCASGTSSTCGSGTSSATSGPYGGLATAQGYTGNTVVYALDDTTNKDGTVVLSNPESFTCTDPVALVCLQNVVTPQFSTVTVFFAGAQTAPSGEYVTAPSDTGTPDLIHCGSQYPGTGGQVCTGTYAVGTKVVLTENLAAGSSYFGGWSTGSGCAEANPTTSPTCTVTLSGNATVGVIFY